MTAAPDGQASGAVISAVALVVPDYDQAIRFFVADLGWSLIQDLDQGRKRWVTVAPPGGGLRLVLAQASTADQHAAIGNQTGGRVFLFLNTDDFWRDYHRMRAAGVQFRETPRHEVYGTVAVWQDPWGNLWDLIGPNAQATVQQTKEDGTDAPALLQAPGPAETQG
jgi:catechol 2,3-dioxygenase-like lactoylglutathione lyase family enzyme